MMTQLITFSENTAFQNFMIPANKNYHRISFQIFLLWGNKKHSNSDPHWDETAIFGSDDILNDVDRLSFLVELSSR